MCFYRSVRREILWECIAICSTEDSLNQKKMTWFPIQVHSKCALWIWRLGEDWSIYVFKEPGTAVTQKKKDRP